MLIREKSMLIIGLTSFLLLFSIIITADSSLISGYKTLEHEDAERQVKRALKAIDYEVATLETMVRDWGQWDDTYKFIEDRNQEYIENNLVEATFITQKINVLVYTDLSGRIVYERVFDWNKRQEMTLTEEFTTKLAAIKPLANRPAFEGINKGILMLPDGPMLIAAGDITNSKGVAPSRGVMIVGRYLNDVEKGRLSEMAQLPLDFASWEGELPGDFALAQASLTHQDIFVNPLDKKYVAGYAAVPDVYGQPALIMRVQLPRDIFTQGQESKNFFIDMLLIAGLVFGAVMLALLEVNVLSRLAGLSNIVENIAQSKDLSVRLPKFGNDELAVLAANINKMLQTLEAAQERLLFVGRHDSLTGLYNRAYFEECLAKAQVADRIAVIVSDVDGLKLVNDTLGHDSGDNLLRRAANALRYACPEDAVIARIGGDELAVLLTNQFCENVEDICRQIKEEIVVVNRAAPEMVLSLSIGYSIGSGQSADVAELLKEADNFMYHEKLLHSCSTRSAIVQTLKKALEVRDFITDGHADRMQYLVRRLGKRLGLAQGKLDELQLFAQFHDIGKVGIPDEILFKPGMLTKEEQVVMRSRSEIGYRIANSSPDLVFIADWVLKHHEWWNGGGYPLGLSGGDIPLECRILALADAYDAMTNLRPYRLPMTEAAAIAELRKNAGIQFDPNLVDDFIEILAKPS